MAYPTKDNIEVLVNTLNDLSKGRFYIWNISEFKYDTSIFNNNVFAVLLYKFISMAR